MRSLPFSLTCLVLLVSGLATSGCNEPRSLVDDVKQHSVIHIQKDGDPINETNCRNIMPGTLAWMVEDMLERKADRIEEDRVVMTMRYPPAPKHWWWDGKNGSIHVLCDWEGKVAGSEFVPRD